MERRDRGGKRERGVKEIDIRDGGREEARDKM